MQNVQIQELVGALQVGKTLSEQRQEELQEAMRFQQLQTSALDKKHAAQILENDRLRLLNEEQMKQSAAQAAEEARLLREVATDQQREFASSLKRTGLR